MTPRTGPYVHRIDPWGTAAANAPDATERPRR